MNSLAAGVWPTMVTPFTDKNTIDYDALERAVEWYIGKGVDGLFAVCQSSEMFCLSLEERVELASFVKRKAAGRVPVIASGHIADRFEDQVAELQAIAASGVDALVLITNRLAQEQESDDKWKNNLEKLLRLLPEELPLGFYECPYPYKRLISPELLRWCANTGRFHFLKDTSCNIADMKAKLEAVVGSNLGIFNANSATLLETLKLGIRGYSGVMANFHPELYGWLAKHWQQQPEQAEALEDLLSTMSLIEKQLYPVNAKYYLMLEGVFATIHSRSRDHRDFTATHRLEIEQLSRLSARTVGQLRVEFSG
ncbi:dihydrodipicolinate synthase family protein [Paenibacillus nasutitermitis]|uniref:Dihydrodipicolinate synthase family protein n=1 Tax=Paenibacillus nasutitermitis TaxID=1652958 RepID=A0A916YNY4_9BACL|nr:dihydrodipicolinate synthase family protein [Paenibacillus nasutitermitis]GGD54086.1 dihydrodipicolinate synthase family protein [Paenibacillus nasutitermitis]